MKNIVHLLRVTFGDHKNRTSIVLIAVTLLGLVLLSFQSKSTPGNTEAPITESDEMIPPGSVLVPLELQNREALQDLVGAFAVVDLFTVSENGHRKGHKVGKRVKLIRSAQNPQQFSALIPEDEAPLLFSNPGPLFAVIQSRQAQSGSSVIGHSVSASRIHNFSNGDDK